MPTRTLLAVALASILAACGSQTNTAPGPGGGNDDPGEAAERDRPDEGPSAGTDPGEGAAGDCVRGGCSGQLCIEEGDDGISTCEYREEYACYEDAACERQPSGQCGFTETAELSACLERARAGDGAGMLR
jgi:hypothetical protein